MSTDWFGFGYAALVLLGGVTGYLKAGSVISLLSGVSFGLMAAYGAYRISHNPKQVWVFIGASASLALILGVRFLRSGQFVPAGLMATLSLFALAKVCVGVTREQKQL